MSTCFIERLDIHSNHLQYCYHTTVNIGNTSPVVLLHNNIATKNQTKDKFLWQLLPGNKCLSDLENQHKSQYYWHQCVIRQSALKSFQRDRGRNSIVL